MFTSRCDITSTGVSELCVPTSYMVEFYEQTRGVVSWVVLVLEGSPQSTGWHAAVPSVKPVVDMHDALTRLVILKRIS